MDLTFTLTPEQEAWRDEVATFCDEAVPSRFAHIGFDYTEDDEYWNWVHEFWAQVGSRGWIGMTWPKEYYGQERPTTDRWILRNEFNNAGAPALPVITDSIVDIYLRLGTHEQQLRHLKGIAAGTDFWAEGYTEPESGSDLASLQTTARAEGDEWVLNGQKTFTTSGHRSNWIMVAARTDPNAPKHAGISYFAVPIDSPGLSFQPLWNVAGGKQNHTFLDDVRVPRDYQVGDLNEGWRQIWFRMGGRELPHDGVATPPFQHHGERILDMVIEYCRETTRNGASLIEDSHTRMQLTDLMLELEGLKMIGYDDNWRNATGNYSPYGAYLSQAVEKELRPRFAQAVMEILGPLASLQGTKWAPLAGEVEQSFRESFGNHAGGTSQLKRMVLATRGLGLPR